MVQSSSKRLQRSDDTEREQAGDSSMHADRVHAQKDPGSTPGGRRTRVPSPGPVTRHSGDGPKSGEVLPPESDTPPLSHYKGTSLKNVGRYVSGPRAGQVIPHKRSERTAKMVAMWAAGGYTKEDIAIRLNIRPGLVEECYGKELRHGAEQIGMDMTSHIIKRAKGGSDRMAIFYAKAKMGWRDGESKPLDTGLLNIHIHT